MKPPADIPLELVLIAEAFARRLQMPVGEFWDVLFRKKPAPPGWAAAWAEAFFPLAAIEDLPSEAQNSTIRTMSTAEIAEPRRGRPASVGKLAAALRKAGVTLTEIADKAKRSPASVRSWAYPKGEDSHRPAPRAVVEMFLDEYGIPLSVWPEITG